MYKTYLCESSTIIFSKLDICVILSVDSVIVRYHIKDVKYWYLIFASSGLKFSFNSTSNFSFITSKSVSLRPTASCMNWSEVRALPGWKIKNCFGVARSRDNKTPHWPYRLIANGTSCPQACFITGNVRPNLNQLRNNLLRYKSSTAKQRQVLFMCGSHREWRYVSRVIPVLLICDHLQDVRISLAPTVFCVYYTCRYA